MTTSTLDVGDLFSILGARGIERQLGRLGGVALVSVNPVSGSTTVTYDAGKTSLPALHAAIRECGFHCSGEALPEHLCEHQPMAGGPYLAARANPALDRTPPTAAMPPGMKMSGMDTSSASVAGMAARGADAEHAAHSAGKNDAMAHEMGHGAGADMQAMVRDMRNRFWIALAFSLPIFALSPMGMDFIKVSPPFGLRLDVVLFVLASGAILYPVWPFLIAAYRALRNGVANMAVLVVLSVGTGYLFSVGSTLL